MWKQLRDASMTVGYIGGWCLKYVQDAFGTDHPYPTAAAAWSAEPNKHIDRPPAGVTVPVYLSLGNVPAGHVAISLSDGYIASSTQSGTHATPYYHKNLDDLIAVYGKYNGGAAYLGWGEHVGSVHVVQFQSANATDDQIRAAYLEILERPADDGGLAHYRNYPIDFVRQDLQDSPEYKSLIANKQAQAAAAAKAAQDAADASAKAIADAAIQAKEEADAKAQADAAAAAQAQADADARQKAIDAQTEADAAASHIQNVEVENNGLLKQILSIVQTILDKITSVFK